MLKSDSRIDPARVLIDHVEEHTAHLVLNAGCWAGITLYPESKCTPPRAIDLLDLYGSDRLWLNSACDWGCSDPLAVPKTAIEMRRRGYDAGTIDRVIFQHPMRFLSQCRISGRGWQQPGVRKSCRAPEGKRLRRQKPFPPSLLNNVSGKEVASRGAGARLSATRTPSETKSQVVCARSSVASQKSAWIARVI